MAKLRVGPRPWPQLALLLHLQRAVGVTVGPSTSVFGHKIPDTDAVCAAIVYSWELNERGIKATPYRLGELNRETEYVLESLDIKCPELLGPLASGESVAIVDTNNPKELPDDLRCASLHSIVDHHKLCGLTSGNVLELDIRPLCSTGSILYCRAKARGLTPPPKIAALMLSCILSDSLEFRSPTTTALDRELAGELAEIAGVDMHAHASAMFDAKAQIDHLSPKEVVMMDSKQYEVGGRQLRVSVLETTAPHMALRQKDALRKAMRAVTAEQGLDDVLLFVVDILREEATFISSSYAAGRIVEAAFSCTVGDCHTAVLPKVLSRKKQIMPALEAAAAHASLEEEAPTHEASNDVMGAPQRVAAAA